MQCTNYTLVHLVLVVEHLSQHERRVEIVAVGYQLTAGASIAARVGVPHDHVTNESSRVCALSHLSRAGVGRRQCVYQYLW